MCLGQVGFLFHTLLHRMKSFICPPSFDSIGIVMEYLTFNHFRIVVFYQVTAEKQVISKSIKTAQIDSLILGPAENSLVAIAPIDSTAILYLL